MGTLFDSQLFGGLYATAPVRECFTSTAMLQGWLDAEVALAQAQGEFGIIPAESAEVIAKQAKAENFDLQEMLEGIQATGHPLVPAVRMLVESCGPEHGKWVHWGATTQDIIDTGLLLQLQRALPFLAADLEVSIAEAAALIPAHKRSMMAGRTHFQHAIPIPFSQKLVIWVDELMRAHERFTQAVEKVAVASLAGAAGTLATLPEEGSRVRTRFAEILGLNDPVVPWHTSRDRVRDLAFALDQIATAAERIGGEVIRMQSTELSELREPAAPQHVGSSTMPQKRNPFTSELMCMNARLVHGTVSAIASNGAHSYERDMVNWSMEWFTIPSVVMLASGVLSKLNVVTSGLEVNVDRMRDNLATSEPLIMSEAIMMTLASEIGHEEAHEIVHQAAALGNVTTEEFLRAIYEHSDQKGVDRALIENAIEPSTYIGLVDDYIAHVERRVGDFV